MYHHIQSAKMPVFLHIAVKMAMSRSEEASGYIGVLSSIVTRSNLNEKYAETLEKMHIEQDKLPLNKAQTCLALGSGAGLKEIEFIKRFMPAINSLTVVEPDSPSVAEL